MIPRRAAHHIARRRLALCFIATLTGCSSLPIPDPSEDGPVEGGPSEGGAAGASADDTEAVVHVFERVPQFGIYVDADPPDYEPPDGVLMWNHGTEFVTKLNERQQTQLGADLAARITYFAQCDEYDRLGGLFVLLEPKDQPPQPDHPRIELVRFVTPFSDFEQGPLSTHVYPDADLSAYASVLADPSHDVWIGIAGGSNPHAGDACTDSRGGLRQGVSADFARVGFAYSVDLASTRPLRPSASFASSALGKTDATQLPIEATIFNAGDERSGHITVIVSGHGSAAGGDEYRHTQDTLTLNGEELGSFGTAIDCAEFASYSPRGNPGIFKGNQLNNPRNWCPGALVPSHTLAATLKSGDNAIRLDIEPSQVPEGSYYSTSIAFTAP